MRNLLKDKNKSCFICSKQFEATEKENGRSVKILSTPCNHLFHRVCLRNWFRNEANGNFCPHCHRSMEWRDATPFGKESTTETQSSSRTNSQSEPDVTVQSVEAEIRQRKAQELLMKKEEAERAKFEVTDEQRAETQERRRLRREAARAAFNAEQNRKVWGKSIFLVALIGSIACATFIIFAHQSVNLDQQQNITLIPAGQRLAEGKIMWQQRLDDINKRIKHLEREIADPENYGKLRHSLRMKQAGLEIDRKDAQAMVFWHHADLTEETMDDFRAEMDELIDLASKALDSKADLKKFFKRDKEIFGEVDEEAAMQESESMELWD